MDITHEVAISAAQSLPHSPSNPDSDQNKRRNVATGIHMLSLVLFYVFDAYLLLL